MTLLLRKILLDEHTDKVLRNSSLAKRKEEATLAAREEIRAQTLREMALKSEVPHEASSSPCFSQLSSSSFSSCPSFSSSSSHLLALHAGRFDQSQNILGNFFLPGF